MFAKLGAIQGGVGQGQTGALYNMTCMEKVADMMDKIGGNQEN